MVAIGACGGLFIVPLNALLQQRGHATIGAGNALAVQNFAENSSMLVFVAVYGAAMASGLAVTTASVGFGLLLLLCIGALALFRAMRR
jgi:LPLT family lysophospholipid transporter-like MFS transporter